MSKFQAFKIADLKPNAKQELDLLFEVAQIISRSSNDEEVVCRVVDQTGIITAFFNQYGKFVVEGHVYQMSGWKCRVHQHHLRLEMTKNSTLSKQPLRIGFRDMENDLSSKFYAVNKDNSEHETKNNETKQQVKQPKKTEKPKYVRSIVPNQQKKESKQEQKTEKIKKKQEESQVEQKLKNKTKIEKQQKSYNYQSQKQTKMKYVQKTKETDNHKGQKEPKIKDYEQKKQEKIKNHTGKQTKYIEKIKLKDFPNYELQNVNLCVKVYLKQSLQNEKYILCKVADSTGSAYIEFNCNVHLQDETWYNLMNFKVFGDKEYGFIAAQQMSSSLLAIGNSEEVVDRKPLFH